MQPTMMELQETDVISAVRAYKETKLQGLEFRFELGLDVGLRVRFWARKRMQWCNLECPL